MLKKALTVVLTLDTSLDDEIYHILNITVTLDGSKGILKGQSQDEDVVTPTKSEGFPNFIVELRGFRWEK
jgi:hypothetical protein